MLQQLACNVFSIRDEKFQAVDLTLWNAKIHSRHGRFAATRADNLSVVLQEVSDPIQGAFTHFEQSQQDVVQYLVIASPAIDLGW